MPVLPAMISGVPGLNCDKRAAAGCRYLVVRDQFAFHYRPVICRFNYTRDQMDWFIRRRWPQKFDCVIRGDCARWMIESGSLHQMVSRGPVAMTVEHGAGDTAAQHPRKRFLISFRLPVSDHFVAPRKAANVQPFSVGGTATKTRQPRRVGFLETFVGHRFIGKCRMRTECSSTTLKCPAQSLRDSSICVTRLAIE
jgi:hypothetical protein